MDLILNTYGTDLMVKDGIFKLVNENGNQSISPLKIDSILVATSITLTSNAIKLALEHDIEIQFIDNYGNSFGKIWHLNYGSIANIRKKQLELANSDKCILFVKKIILEKIESQVNFLITLKRYRSASKQEKIDESVIRIHELSKLIVSVEGKVEEVRNQLMGYEGNISKIYFQTLSYLLPNEYQFIKRTRQPAKDVFNAFLNYGYGILYSKVEIALIRAGLDPYIGIFNVDGYN
jgi:CRISPR-associated protein Cas1